MNIGKYTKNPLVLGLVGAIVAVLVSMGDAKMKNEKKQSSSYVKLFVLSFLLVAGVSYFCFSKATEKMTGGSQCSINSSSTGAGESSTGVAVNENVLTDLPDF